jgi:hypothetical protein
VVALGQDEEDACACALKVQGAVEVHLLVLQLLCRRGLLGLCPLGDEISEDLRLDGLLWVELQVELSQLDRPHDDAPYCIATV